MRALFQSRRHAGQQLATRLAEYANRSGTIVLGLARSGVPVASEVARALALPLDVFVVRRLGAPDHPKQAIGAIASGGVRVLDARVIRELHVSDATIARVTSEEHLELERREDSYRNMRPTPDVQGRTVILIDDALIARSALFLAVAALQKAGAAAIVVAVPVAGASAHAAMSRVADRCVAVATPEQLEDVAAWYEEFPRTTDAQVRTLLDAAAWRQGTNGHPPIRAPLREKLAPPPS